MQWYILKRLFQSALSLLVLITIVFFAVYMSGNPLNALLSVGATKEQALKVQTHYGLDKPVYVQYGKYLKRLLKGDLGTSIITRRPVTELIRQRIPASLQLASVAMMIALAIALPVGVYSAVKRGRAFDTVGKSVAVILQSTPLFWLGLVLILVFAVWLGLLPTSGRRSLNSVVLPAVALGTTVLTGVLRLTRSSMLEVLDSEYLKLARIKGLAESVVIWKHAFRNALPPVLTYSAVLLANLIAGSIVTETVFAWPGLGLLIVDAARNRDVPLIQGLVFFIGSLALGANLLVDVLYCYLDPKIRLTR